MTTIFFFQHFKLWDKLRLKLDTIATRFKDKNIIYILRVCAIFYAFVVKHVLYQISVVHICDQILVIVWKSGISLALFYKLFRTEQTIQSN